ncbi:MAG: endopeptidase La [Oscillospiraceae bacterium]|nr:endopeptidase La [Oscillospiraceae bacterium]
MSENKEKALTRGLPMLALRGLTAFPGMLLTFDIERPMSMAALNFAMGADQNIFLVTQKDVVKDIPAAEDLFSVGTVCRIRQQLKQPNGTSARIMVEGVYRGRVREIVTDSPSFYAEVERVPDAAERVSEARREALIRSCVTLFEEYVRLSENAAPEIVLNILSNNDAGYVADFVANTARFKYQDKQLLLEETHPTRRLAMLCRMLNNELNVMTIEQELSNSTAEQMNKNQREYYLREELKIIQKELGDGEDAGDDAGEYKNRILALNLADKETEEKLLKEARNLAKQPFGSAEGAVIRSYLDTCLSLPWNTRTEETLDVAGARKMLDEDHYGLDKVKKRILEYLAVRQLTPDVKGGLLCLVGPPGTGKTSIALSVARATNRKLVRISLGGVHDEAEIRGHRKTYIGAMPGRIMAGVIQAKSANPLMVLDEIDKLGSDYRGDPSAALLEALDGEQNTNFRDHYLEIPWDLSSVFFITTANTTETIPRALLDRMEVIELSSYTDEEKLQIARQHLIPKQRKKHGLKASQLKISDDGVRAIVSLYTRESGVRVLERSIASICRRAATRIAEGSAKSVVVGAKNLPDYLGVPKFKPEPPREANECGLVRGLAWTQVGGEVLDVEVAVVPGSGKLELTGNLGDVMKESAHAAVTYIRSRAQLLGIAPDFYKEKDIHIHFPEGAVPKDGPSAGITICVALISALTGIPARRDVAMTGEITLRGRILPIGGLREKTMAALRNGVNTVIIPADNEADLKEIDPLVRKALNFITTDHVDKILDEALVKAPGGRDEPAPVIPKAKGGSRPGLRH